MELLIGGASGLAALIGAIWGIVKYYDQKRAKKQEEQDAAVKEQEEIRNKLLQDIHNSVNQMREDNIKQHEEIVGLKVIVEDLDKKVDENEVDRLRADIIDGANKLQNGLIMSQVDFEHIHHSYDKYKKRGGNSYIDGCMADIVEYEKECRLIANENDED